MVLRVFPDAARVEQALLDASAHARFVDATGFWSFGQLVAACTPAGLHPLSSLEHRTLVAAAVRELPEGPFGAWARDVAFAHAAADLFTQLESQLASPQALEEGATATDAPRASYLARLWKQTR